MLWLDNAAYTGYEGPQCRAILILNRWNEAFRLLRHVNAAPMEVNIYLFYLFYDGGTKRIRH